MRHFVIFASLAAVVSCSSKEETPSGTSDSGMDTGIDSGFDGATDTNTPADTAVADAVDTNLPSERRAWIASDIELPATSARATALGIDQDGDGTVDNQLGAVLGAWGSATTLDLRAEMSDAVMRGDALLLVEMLAPSFVDATSAEGRVLQGKDPNPMPCMDSMDTICGKHLTGSGTFSFVAPAPARTAGKISAGKLDVGPGAWSIPVVMINKVVWLPLRNARMSATLASGDKLETAKLTGAIARSDIDSILFPAVHGELVALIARDCTSSGCTSGSTGETLLSMFDTDMNRTVTLMEFRDHSLLSSVFAPDLDLDADGTKDALSAGIGFSAVRATFTP